MVSARAEKELPPSVVSTDLRPYAPEVSAETSLHGCPGRLPAPDGADLGGNPNCRFAGKICSEVFTFGCLQGFSGVGAMLITA